MDPENLDDLVDYDLQIAVPAAPAEYRSIVLYPDEKRSAFGINK